jgi:hypothetical protein
METEAPVETVEKPKNGFPTVPTGAWKTLRKKRSEFPTVPTAPTMKEKKNKDLRSNKDPMTLTNYSKTPKRTCHLLIQADIFTC